MLPLSRAAPSCTLLSRALHVTVKGDLNGFSIAKVCWRGGVLEGRGGGFCPHGARKRVGKMCNVFSPPLPPLPSAASLCSWAPVCVTRIVVNQVLGTHPWVALGEAALRHVALVPVRSRPRCLPALVVRRAP